MSRNSLKNSVDAILVVYDVLKFVKDLVDENDEYKYIRAIVNEVVNEDMSGNFSAKVLKIMGIEK